MGLWDIVRKAATRFPDRVAVTTEDRELTYAELDDLVERTATGLRFQGLGPGDRVVTVLGNTLPHLELLLGCFRAELVAVPMATWSIKAQVRYAVRQSAARGIVAPRSVLEDVFDGNEKLRPDVAVPIGDPNPPRWAIPWEVIEAGPGDCPPPPTSDVDHLALIVYTSGTTSRPKAVVHSQDRMARRAEVLAEELGLTSDDVAFVSFGIGRPIALLGQVFTTFLVGGRVILHDFSGPKAFWAGYSAAPPKTFVLTTPGILVDLLEDPGAIAADHSRLRHWICGGDAVPAAVHSRFRSITGHSVFEMCGMTEAGFYALNRMPGPGKTGCLGRLLRGVEARVVDPCGVDVPPGDIGEIYLRSPDLMIGFWNDTVETFRALRDGWLHTGDLARVDEKGLLWFAGRCKDMISRGGLKVAPPMVEDALTAHPAVDQSVVVGAPCRAGQVPFAFLTLRPEADRPTEAELREWLADRLDAQAIPDRFVVLADWPRTYQGKLDRERLRWMAANGGDFI